MRKGNLVRLNVAKCFSKRNGGELTWALGTMDDDDNGLVIARRPTTDKEQREWRTTPAARGMNDAGELKLPPQSTMVKLRRDMCYMVLRARCQVRLGWGNPVPGMVKVLDTETGEQVYLKRELVEVVSK